MMTKHENPLYLTSNILCVINTRTNGPIPRKHDLLEVQFLPIDFTFDRAKEIPPLSLKLQPKYHKAKFENFLDVNHLPYMKAAYLFEKWFGFFKKKEKNRIFPIAYNWAESRPFLEDWFGYDEDKQSYLYDFVSERFYRDICSSMSFLQDAAWLNGLKIPFNFLQPGLRGLMNYLNIAPFPKENTFAECMNILNVYKALSSIRIQEELFTK